MTRTIGHGDYEGDVTACHFIATCTDKPPIETDSTEWCRNLNSDMLDGHHWDEISFGVISYIWLHLDPYEQFLVYHGIDREFVFHAVYRWNSEAYYSGCEWTEALGYLTLKPCGNRYVQVTSELPVESVFLLMLT